MNDEGRTLIEVVMAMALVLVMMAFTGASLMAANAKQRGRVVATDLANELRAARYLAIMRREPIRVVLEPGTATMRVEPAGAPGQKIREFDFREKGLTIERTSSGTDILFHPSGRAASPATITLINHQKERWQLTVSLIGRVSQI